MAVEVGEELQVAVGETSCAVRVVQSPKLPAYVDVNPPWTQQCILSVPAGSFS